MQTKKIPMRMCTGCGEMKPKRELVRVVKNSEGEISLDLTGKAQGRGAYVCRSIDCLKKARKSRRIERSFKCRIPDELYDKMETEMIAGE
ncbi:MAG: YlxR family protein [Massilioclostridium sp.]|nr:YlxR family protein [Massilioclostridium sp.]